MNFSFPHILQPLKMVFHFKWKSREIGFDKEWYSVLSQRQLEKFCFSIELSFDSNRVALNAGLLHYEDHIN